MARDLEDYGRQYGLIPFEPIQAEYRRRHVLETVRRHAPARLLEVGCGERPLFLDLPDTACCVVEPTRVFAEKARRLALGRRDVEVIEATIEEAELEERRFDLVVVSCVLHEVPDPQAMLRAVVRASGPTTIVHVNVPNAHSLHRLLAVAMGLVQDPAASSALARTMQQRAMYDRDSFHAELERAGLRVGESGTLFVKPFTHAQMQALVDSGFMTTQMLDGFDRLVRWLPDLGSELWADGRVLNV